jgi:hypothetical protein
MRRTQENRMSTRQLTDGSPVPEDGSHTAINPHTGQQRGYVVLSPEERAKGFVKPYRDSYIHETCGVQTKMGRSLSETYARDPRFYSGTFCVGCGSHFPLNQFHWDADKEPMDPDLQEAWHAAKPAREKAQRDARRHERMQHLQREIGKNKDELNRLQAEAAAEGPAETPDDWSTRPENQARRALGIGPGTDDPS